MEPKVSPSLLDVVDALLERDREEEAFDILATAAYAAVVHGVKDVETLLQLPIDEYVRLYAEPPHLTVPEPMGWDRVYYGKAAFKKGENA